jgi:transcription elongation factor GreA
MPQGAFHMSRIGYEKLRKELGELKKKRPALSEEIGVARELGDLKENAEYHAAKEALAHLQSRIFELENKLRSARLIEDENLPSDIVYIGATVSLKNIQNKEQLEWTLVSSEEADVAEGRISVDSPIAQGLLGHKVGDSVKISIPAGIIEYEIIKITRE